MTCSQFRETDGRALKEARRVDQIMRYCLADHQNREETRKRFEQIRQSESSYLNRRLRFLLVLASSAPLIGLLGTVAGMLRTFAGMSMGESYKMDLVASGISQALVTTQAGLLIAIPALAFLHLLNRRKNDWLRCLNRMESISMRQISPHPSLLDEKYSPKKHGSDRSRDQCISFD